MGHKTLPLQHDEIFCNFFLSNNIQYTIFMCVRTLHLSDLISIDYFTLARMGKREVRRGFWWGDLRESDHLGDPGVDYN
jgi:hypothetical protein